MVYGLAAALGWGLADFGAAVAGRRLGSVATALVSQSVTAVAMTAIFVAGHHRLSELGPIAGWVAVSGAVSASAYLAHYRALELGPVAVVSPIGAAYALVGLVLAVALLGERPGAVALVGGVVTVAGVMLSSTNLRGLTTGTRAAAGPGVRWALVSMVLFGVGAFFLGWFAQRVGWVPGLWASRVAQVLGLTIVAAIRRPEVRPARMGGAGAAALVGAADLLGVVAYSAGAAAGFVSIVLVASAVFPLITIALAIPLLGERPVANQYVGVALVVIGLLMLGLG
ncbi:MAG TPA: EamA family transporter [Actinomycetota bacterium]|nr:EamA family transporter [Actinomycetota bacterium]